MQRPMIDTDHFAHMTGGDTALQAELMALFSEQADLWGKLLTTDAPVHTWRDAAHTIKGSARGLGFWVLAEACETAEALAKSGLRDGPLVTEALRAVRHELGAALIAGARVIAEGGAEDRRAAACTA